ncbi:MAG TPA: TolC family protein [Bacteroidales bacterium]
MFKYLRFISLLILFQSAQIQAQLPTQTLDYFLKQGLENSPLLRDYQNQLSSSTIDSLLIKAGQEPKVDANAQVLYAPVYHNFGYDEASTNGGNYTGVVGISQNFLNQKELRNKYESVEIQKRSVSNTFKISYNDLTRIITAQYLNAFADFSDLTFNKNFLKLMEDQQAILKKLVESGIYKQTDYLSLLIETQTQEITLKQASSQYYKDLLLLYQLCGLNDTSHTDLATPIIHRKNLDDVAQSPLLAQFKIDSLKISNSRSAVDVLYRPKLNWFADAGLLSTSPSTLYQHFGYSAGINFSIPIYDGKQRKLQYRKLDFTEDTRSNYEHFFKKQYSQQIMQLKSDLATAEETLDQLKKQQKTAEDLMTMVKSLLNTGNISITEFINATKNYDAINRTLNQTQIKILQTINELNYWMQQ